MDNLYYRSGSIIYNPKDKKHYILIFDKKYGWILRPIKEKDKK